jgi:septal ring-binding cell division protein DamX
MRWVAALTVLTGLAVVIAPAAFGQSDPRLANAVRLAQEGLGDSARSVVQRVVAATPPTDSLYAEALYARAMVAAEPEAMRRDLQRIAVEYPNSSWADDALLHLAQLDFAAGDLDGATRDLERLRLDYPDTPLLAQAALWAARAYFDRNNPRAACGWLDQGLARAGSDVELKNQLEYYRQRCAGALASANAADSAARADSAKAKTSADSAARADSTAQAAKAKAKFRIQLAAVNTQVKADSIARKVTRAGFEPVIVKDKGLLKIRVGGYPTRAEANAALAQVRAKLGGKPFVVAEP